MERIRQREAEFYELKCLWQEQQVQITKLDERKHTILDTFFKMKEGYIDVLRAVKKEYERIHGLAETSVVRKIDSLIGFIGRSKPVY